MHRLAAMSFLEPAAHSRVSIGDVRFGSKADIWTRLRDVRFTPESGHLSGPQECPLSAKSGHRGAEGVALTATQGETLVLW